RCSAKWSCVGGFCPEAQKRELKAEHIIQRVFIVEPQVRCAATGASRGHILVRFIGRRCSAVSDHDRRAIVAPTKGNARNVELEAGVVVEMIACNFPCRLALRGVILQFHRRDVPPDRIGETACVPGIAPPKCLSLDFVTREESRSAPALWPPSKFPTAIDRIV